MITNLLIFFAIPLAVVIISIALQKILENPFLVAGIVFSILLVIVLAFLDPIYLIAVVAYTILSFVTAILTCLLSRILSDNMCNCMCSNQNNLNEIVDISNNNYQNDTINNNINNEFSGTTGSYCKRYNRRIR